MLRAALVFLVVAMTSADAFAQTQPVPVEDPGVLFWSPQRREHDLRIMDRLVPHATVAAAPVERPLVQGRPLVLDVDDFMETERVAGLIVIQGGEVRLERYGLALRPDDHWASFSVTKSVTSTLIGAAIQDGLIGGLDDPIERYIPEMAGSAYDGVTLRHLLTMTSGVRWNEDYADPGSDVSRLFTTRVGADEDPTVEYLRQLERENPPGVQWRYNTGETNLAGVLLRRAINRPIADYLSEKVWRPAGMAHPAMWMLDVRGHETGGCCLSATLRDWARFGLFTLERGVVNGRGVAPASWFDDATRTQTEIGAPGRGYGYLWWTHDTGVVQARGIFGQTIHIDPRRNLVVVILSAWPVASAAPRSEARSIFLTRLEAALDQEPWR